MQHAHIAASTIQRRVSLSNCQRACDVLPHSIMYKCIFVKPETASLIRIIRDGLLASSAVLLIFLWLCYWGRFDFCTAVTVYPPWCWAVGGLVITGIGFSRRLRAASIVLVAGWMLF